MATYNATCINWGNGLVTCSVVGVSDMTLLQSSEYASESDSEMLKDKNGETKGGVFFDHRAKISLEFIPTQGTTAGGTLTITAWPSAGDVVTLTSGNDFSGMNVKGLLDGITFTRSNTRAMMARINLTRYLVNSIPA